jgi:hypothetical protein
MCLVFCFFATLTMIGYVSLSIRGFSTSMRWLHNPGSVGIRNADARILIGDRQMILRVLLIANKDKSQGVSW